MGERESENRPLFRGRSYSVYYRWGPKNGRFFQVGFFLSARAMPGKAQGVWRWSNFLQSLDAFF